MPITASVRTRVQRRRWLGEESDRRYYTWAQYVKFYKQGAEAKWSQSAIQPGTKLLPREAPDPLSPPPVASRPPRQAAPGPGHSVPGVPGGRETGATRWMVYVRGFEYGTREQELRD